MEQKKHIVNVKTLKGWEKNPRGIKKDAFERLKRQIAAHGQFKPLLVTDNGEVIGGNMRLKAYQALGITDVWVSVVTPKDETEKIAIALADNDRAGYYEEDALAELIMSVPDLIREDYYLDLGETISLQQLLNKLGPDGTVPGEGIGSLEEKFLVPPFSVLDARQGYWQDRKRAWLALGIKSEKGRDKGLLGFNSLAAKFGNRGGANESNTSVFDPVLCELAYLWFSPKSGLVIDPFAGGSVRGVVASKLGRQYIGFELRAEQVEENREQALQLCQDIQPVWVAGDSAETIKPTEIEADFLFTCPPYADLEVYSDDPKDISTMPYKDFMTVYRRIIFEACLKLKNNRFACVVVGEIRDKKGVYRNFVGDTVQAFMEAGLEYYNEAILVTSVGSLPLRIGRQFTSGRKVGKTHQNVLVFLKGDSKKATDACGIIKMEDISGFSDDEVPEAFI